MEQFDPLNLPPVCVNWCTDVLAKGPAAGRIERAVALDGLRGALTSQPGYVTQAACKVEDCPVQCTLYSGTDRLGSLVIAGAASEEGITDLTNCVR
jgi:hypothetical protein